MPLDFPGYPDQETKSWGVITNRPPQKLFSLDDNIPFHATRLLLLIKVSGRPVRKPRIEGRTKLAKLDFFVRYPPFLDKAAQNLLSEEQYQLVRNKLVVDPTVESHMIRYKYGPWDKKYYLILAYLNGKNLIKISSSANNVDLYELSPIGDSLSSTLMELQQFETIVTRCRIVGDIFGNRNGTWIKKFIYRTFPEVVHTPYTQLISNPIEDTDSDE